MYANGPKIPTDGLIVCLDAGNIKSYPTSGTLWTDVSRNNNDGTLFGSVVSGVFSGASFDAANQGSLYMRGTGFNDYITVPSGNFDIGNKAPNCSLSIWCNGASVNFQNIDLAGFIDGVDFDFNLSINSFSNVVGSLRTATSTSSVGTDFTVFINKWTCFTLTATSNLLSLYTNGRLRNTAAVSGNFGSIGSDFRIGLMNNSMFKGYISSILFYKRALSAQEVMQCYNAYKGRYKL